MTRSLYGEEARTLTDDDPFLRQAELQTPHPVKMRQQAVAKRAKVTMVPTPAEKAIRDQEKLLRWYKKYWRERVQELRDDPTYGERMTQLLKLLKSIGGADFENVLTLLKVDEWRHAESKVKLDVLHVINDFFCKARLKAGLPEINDPLPDQEPDTWIQIRDYLREKA